MRMSSLTGVLNPSVEMPDDRMNDLSVLLSTKVLFLRSAMLLMLIIVIASYVYVGIYHRGFQMVNTNVWKKMNAEYCLTLLIMSRDQSPTK